MYDAYYLRYLMCLHSFSHVIVVVIVGGGPTSIGLKELCDKKDIDLSLYSVMRRRKGTEMNLHIICTLYVLDIAYKELPSY